jgi:hypothetical protein
MPNFTIFELVPLGADHRQKPQFGPNTEKSHDREQTLVEQTFSADLTEDHLTNLGMFERRLCISETVLNIFCFRSLD